MDTNWKHFQATLKAKQRILKEDLEFFKQQRRLLEAYVAKSNGAKKGDGLVFGFGYSSLTPRDISISILS